MLARLVELLPAIIKKTGSGIERGAILVMLVNTLFMLAILGSRRWVHRSRHSYSDGLALPLVLPLNGTIFKSESTSM